MRGWAAPLALCAGLVAAGCGTRQHPPMMPPGGGARHNDHPVLIVARGGGLRCNQIDQPSIPIHVRRGDTVTFEFRNTCRSDEPFQVVDPDGIFGAPPPPVVVPGKSTGFQTLTIESRAAYGLHKTNIRFKGKDHDPRFEIDP